VVPRVFLVPLKGTFLFYIYFTDIQMEVQNMDYSKTLNLPKTDFPMRANLPSKEPEIMEFWEKEDIYRKNLEKFSDRPKFILHDGPPYANGDIHLGHTLNKILKDIVIKFKSMDGYCSPYVPGWDTHGLPIETQAIKALGINRHEKSPVEFRDLCRDFALKYMDLQRKQFKRLGVRGDWENPYLTLQPKFEAKQIEVFGEMAKKGYIYKGLKPVYWCPDCETALAEAEIEYADHRTHSIYVKFPLFDDKGLLKKYTGSLDNVYIMIWTTTPWTLPANLAIALNPELTYILVELEGEYHVIAKEKLDEVKEVGGIEEHRILAEFKGEELEGLVCKHPFVDRDSLVILGEHVTLEQGTGCVHTAPGHGEEDFEVGKKYGLDVLNPVDDRGYFTAAAGKYKGMYYEKANDVIVEDLKKSGAMYANSKIMHSYPHCWRCKGPVIFRATEQWFASVEGFREEALRAIKDVKWIPAWGEERISNMVKERADWCISRQRVWGVPIPIFYCEDCGKHLINDETIQAVKELFAKEGSDAWFIMEPDEILPDGVKCEGCGGAKFRKETDIMDVWFDSGSSHAAVLETTPGLEWPSTMYLEGSDQHRGWFQSSLLTAVATRGRAPYEEVLTHGFVVDGEGRKMSKSLGNGIDPMEVIEEYGADILRLWVASADYKTDVRISPKIIKQLSEVYRKIRNTARFMLGNLYDFAPDKDSVEYEALLELDKWAMHRGQKLLEKVLKAYRDYEFHILFHAIHNFCVVDMSNFYLDVIKDRLYTFKPESVERRAAQTVMYKLLLTLVRLIAPVLTFTAEEIWQYLPGDPSKREISVQLEEMPQVEEKYINEELDEKYRKVLEVRYEVARALEKARANKVIGHSLDARVDLYTEGQLYDFLKSLEEELPYLLIVSQVKIHRPDEEAPDGALEGEDLKEIKVTVAQAEGIKCQRCWNYSVTTGQSEEYPDICSRCLENIK
jgi:isoleucyl-tRNA synthetase